MAEGGGRAAAMSSEEAGRRLAAEARNWSLEDGAITRRFTVNGFKSAMLAANAVGHLAEAAWHHPEITIAWGAVTVRLWSHDAGGVTARDLALAAKIDALLDWRPEPPLEGAPTDPRHAYIVRE
ncbi:MAG TPA: 4a-hydroxytetrahydrobiopterin dehydratase [Beijerinckiaceae bacterium]